MPRRRHASRGRRATQGAPRPATPSIAEVAVYGTLGSLIAAGLLILAGQPRWVAVSVVGGTVVLIGLLAWVARRTRDTGRRRRRRKR